MAEAHQGWGADDPGCGGEDPGWGGDDPGCGGEDPGWAPELRRG